jgi:hypothetical protein
MLMLELEAPGCKGKGKRQAIVCFGHYKTLEQGPIDECGGGREWGGPQWQWRRSARIRCSIEAVVWTQQREWRHMRRRSGPVA